MTANVTQLLRDAEAAEDQERYDEARSLLERARRVDPKNSDALLGLARLTRYTGKFADAIPLAQEAAKLAPERIDVEMELAKSASTNRLR